MSEETVVEKSPMDMLSEAIASVVAPVVAFLFLACLFTIMLYTDKISPDMYRDLLLSGALVSALLKLLKKEQPNA